MEIGQKTPIEAGFGTVKPSFEEFVFMRLVTNIIDVAP
jgi:hypothetical protein